MANRSFIILTGLFMVAALVATLWGRPVLFPTEARSTPSDTMRKQVDPPMDGAIVVYYHERRPYYVTTPNQVHGLIADRVNWVFKPAKDFQVIHFSDVPPGNNRYLICSRRIEEMTLLRLNRAIKDYRLGSMAPNPTVMAATL